MPERHDETIPGGIYIVGGVYVNAEGQYVDVTGKRTDEPQEASITKARPEPVQKGGTKE